MLPWCLFKSAVAFSRRRASDRSLRSRLCQVGSWLAIVGSGSPLGLCKKHCLGLSPTTEVVRLKQERLAGAAAAVQCTVEDSRPHPTVHALPPQASERPMSVMRGKGWGLDKPGLSPILVLVLVLVRVLVQRFLVLAQRSLVLAANDYWY